MKNSRLWSSAASLSSPNYLIWGIFLCALVIRLTGLGVQSIWIDEAFSIHASQQALMDVVMLQDPTPPLYYICLHFWMKLFGNDPVAARALSAVFGSLAILAIYGVASRLESAKVGLVAALLLTVSPINIYLSQLTRTYALLTLLSTVSIFLYLGILENRKPGRVWLYMVCNILLVYAHVFGWFVIVVQNLHYLWRTRGVLFTRERWWIYTQMIPVAFFLPWFYRYITHFHDHDWVASVQFITQFETLAAHLIVGIEESPLSALVILPTLALLVFKRSRQGLLYVWLIAPIVFPVLVSLLVTPIFTAKYIYYVAIPATILLARALMDLKWKRQAIMLALIVFTGCAIHQQTRLNHDPWDQVSAYIKQIRKAEPIIVIKFYETKPLIYYYDRSVFNAPDYEQRLLQEGILGIEGLDEVKKHAYPELLLITSRVGLEMEMDEIEAYYSDHYETVSSRTFIIESGEKTGNKITVRLLHQRASSAGSEA